MHHFLISTLLIASLLAGSTVLRADDAAKLELIEAKKVWAEAPHNAFTDLVRFKDTWFCVFREGKGHVSPDGALRIITSKDGAEWKSAALITMEGADLRDAKICVTPDGGLMLSGAAALHQPNAVKHKSFAWFSNDGRDWSRPVAIGDANFWLWRTTWNDKTAYSIGYATVQPHIIRLYRSKDGRTFETLIEDMKVPGYPNETAMIFREDGSALCLLRRDPDTGMLGEAKPPHTHWTWKDLGVRLGGPLMIELPDGRLIATVRLYDKPVRTSVCWIDAANGKLTEALKLPSGGDTSYAGMVMHEGVLWISYYASHEGKTAIYLAKVKVGSST